MVRHSSLADQLTALRSYVTAPDHEPEPVQTNWATFPANDNDPEDVEDLHVERRWRMKPSVEEIMRQVASGDIDRGPPSEMEIVKDGVVRTVTVPGPILRIGKLHFSDGTQTEAGFKLVMGEPIAARIRMPAGAMLGTKDAEEGQLGGEADPQHITASNDYFAATFDVKPRAYQSGGRRKRGRNISHAEAKAMLAEAYANTDMSKVTFTRYPDGLPAGSPKVSDNFLGLQKTTCGDSGSTMWQDIVSAKADRKEWFDAVDALKAKDRGVLEAAMTAKTMKSVGISMGYAGKTAERRGKRALIAANNNLMAAIDAYAA